MGDKLSEHIDCWKKQLLDFGKRNRLINFKDSKRSNLVITSPAFDELYEKIIVDEKTIIFPYAKQITFDENGEEELTSVVEGDVKTPKTIDDLQKTLKALRYKANTFIEEQGINTLYLSFGLFRWKENDNSDEYFSAPLILVPVKLSIKSLTSPYELSLHEDEIVVNPTLLHKLENDWGIIIPKFDSNQDSDIKSYFKEVNKIVKDKAWYIDPTVNLTCLSFLKINMYKDLDNNQDRLKANAIVSAIAGDGDPQTVSSELNNYDHDSNIRPIDSYQVVDADSSQQDAILLSKRSKSFVLQGPPGTGKSQTITNIISEALADGKKVLFVSEKMAALQVVYKRLTSLGLGDFCMTLHNHRANKKEILTKLGKCLYIDRKRVRDEALAELDLLERRRNSLNDYDRELHTQYSALNLSIFKVNGRLAKLHNVPEFSFEISKPDKVTESELGERIYILKELTRVLKEHNKDISQNIWKGANIEILTHQLRHDIDSAVKLFVQIIPQLEEAYVELSKALLISAPSTIENIERIIDFISLNCKTSKILKSWIYLEDIDSLLKNIEEDKTLYDDLAHIENEICKEYDKEILDLDYYPILQRYRTEYNSIFKIFKKAYRKDIQIIRSYLKINRRISDTEATTILEQLKIYSEHIRVIAEKELKMKNLYEEFFKGKNTDWNEIIQSIFQAKDLCTSLESIGVNRMNAEELCCNSKYIHICRENKTTLSTLYNIISSHFEWFNTLFEDKKQLKSLGLADLCKHLAELSANKHMLEEWIDYKTCRKQCEKEGMLSYMQIIEGNNLDPDTIEDIYLKRFYTLWLDAVLVDCPNVRNFRSRNQEETIKEFCKLDKEQFIIAQARVREKIIAGIPDFNLFTSTKDEVGILKRELTKQRKLMPLRQLFASIPNLMTALKPCFMMSPLSVSVFLEAKSYEFDLVIFDEASQVHTEDAIGAIMRAKQVIIVGDTKQLPPTNFFAASLNDDEFDTDIYEDDKYSNIGAYESILDESLTVLPERSLRWHYRSRHEHLIAFSNAKIYNNNLITFPSTKDKVKDSGVEYVFVENGIYERGGKKNNIAEAKRVADLVFEHFRNYPKRSLGVVTFSEAQQSAIDGAIRQKRLSDPSLDKFFEEELDEGFFIKNLENVQGDERDTIIFSIGYAKDATGVMYMNFGPLSRDGGYRRLNVAITRAKFNVKLVGSIRATDIDLERTTSEGVKMLRSYIEFAQQGVIALQKEITYSENPVFESPFEESVYDILVSKGYQVITQVGCSGFRIDMAIKHPTNKGEFILGIECDGAAYHSSRTARERDRLRQDVLESMGWKIYRIWSTDWIKNEKSEIDKLINAIEKVMSIVKCVSLSENNNLEGNEDDKGYVIDDNITINIEEKIAPATSYKSGEYSFIEYKYIDYNDLRNLSISESIKHILGVEQPIHFDDLCRRIACKFGREKITSVVMNGVKSEIYGYRLRNDVIIDKNNFVTTKGFELKTARKCIGIHKSSIKYISQEEIIIALRILLTHSFGISRSDLVLEISKTLGYQRASANILSVIDSACDVMIEQEIAREADDKIYINENVMKKKLS